MVMVKSNKSNLEEKNWFAEKVTRFPCLYDKSNKGYKKKKKKGWKKNEWLTVENALGLEEGT